MIVIFTLAIAVGLCHSKKRSQNIDALQSMLSISGLSKVVGFLAITAFMFQAASAQTNVTIQPSSADATLNQAAATTNDGTNAVMVVKPYATSWTNRAIVMFDLSSIPAGATIVSATLSLKQASTYGSTRTIGAHRVTQSWTEAGVSWNKRDGTTSWTTAGGTFAASPTATASVSWGGSFVWNSWDVTSDVSAFIAGSATNYGWVMKDQTENSSQQYWGFATNNTGTSSDKPKLEVTYNVPITSNSGSFNWNNTSAWVGGAVPTANDDVIIASGSTITLVSNITRNANTAMNVSGTLNCATYVVGSGGANSTFTLESGGTLGIGSTTGIASSGASGNIQTANRSFSSTGNYTFNGSSAQITGNALPSTVHNLTINNATGVTLSNSTTVTSALNLTSGRISLSSYNLILNNGVSLTGGSGSSFVYTNGTGVMTWKACSASTSRTFPIGHSDASSGYIPLIINFKSGHTTDDFSARALDKITDDGTNSGTPYTSTVVKSTWVISEAESGGSIVDLTFQWNGSDEGTSFSRSACHIARYTGSTWDDLNSDSTASGSNPYHRTLISYTGNFSSFGIGGAGGPLPIDLLYVKGIEKDNHVEITWATASEQNNDYFTIERSNNGREFESIGDVSGAGNSTHILEYSFIDMNVSQGTYYYRLRQTDFDGTTTLSDILMVQMSSASSLITIFPNPSSDFVRVQMTASSRSEIVTVSLLNIDGSILKVNELNHATGNDFCVLDLTELPTGVYTIIIDENGLSRFERLLIAR